ncbi:hypothetical protein F4678DRAFT_465499 [Xylaria arbuscula]|nr:hypothetical protein F4678DRAFT_465499 [Xylaria arbuscula]
MHLAVATYMISVAPWAFQNKEQDTAFKTDVPLNSAYEELVLAFVERYRCTEDLTLKKQHPQGITLPQVGQYLNMHYAVYDYARVLAACAIETTHEDLGLGSTATPTMLLRYEKALYVMQLVSALFSWRGTDQSPRMNDAWGVFWYSFYPWEVEQVYCVETLLLEHIKEIILDENSELRAQMDKRALRLFTKYVIYQGPSRLWGLEMKREAKGPSAILFLSCSFLQWRKVGDDRFIYLGTCPPGFWFKLHTRRAMQLLNPLSCPEYDIGLMKLWYLLAVVRDYERYREPPDPDVQLLFSNIPVIIFSGYALWDELKVHGKDMPDMDELRERWAEIFKREAQEALTISPICNMVPSK